MKKKLYVGNLSFETTENELQELFGQTGSVETVRIIMDRETGRSKGFGFVEMQTGGDEAIAVMNELGIDISGQRSKHVDEVAGTAFDYVLTVCDQAREACPVFPAQTQRLRHDFQDPAAFEGSEEERLAVFRRVRDEIRTYLKTFPPAE